MIRFERLFTIVNEETWRRNQPSYRSRIPYFPTCNFHEWSMGYRPLPMHACLSAASLATSSLMRRWTGRVESSVEIRREIVSIRFVRTKINFLRPSIDACDRVRFPLVKFMKNARNSNLVCRRTAKSKSHSYSIGRGLKQRKVVHERTIQRSEVQ